MKHNGKFVNFEKMGKKIQHMIALGYECEVVLETFTDGIMYFHHKDFTTIAVPITDWNTFDEVEIEYNELGTIKRLYK